MKTNPLTLPYFKPHTALSLNTPKGMKRVGHCWVLSEPRPLPVLSDVKVARMWFEVLYIHFITVIYIMFVFSAI